MTNLVISTAFPLNKVAAPNLPLATAEYDRQYQDQLNNVLRLYFNRLDALFSQFQTADTTAALLIPYGAFHQDGTTVLTGAMTNVSTTPIRVTSTVEFPSAGALLIESELVKYTGKTSNTFTGITRGAYGTTNVSHAIGKFASDAIGVPSPTTAIPITMTTADASYGMALDPLLPSRIICTIAGVYNFAFSVQLLNYTTTDDNVTLWWKKNGVDVPFSAGIAQVPPKHGSSPGAGIIAWNILIEVSVTDYVELYFASDTGETVCATYPAGTAPVHPISPAAILTATFVSALPA